MFFIYKIIEKSPEMTTSFNSFTITYDVVSITMNRECAMSRTFQCCNFPSFNIVQYGSINTIIIFRAQIFWDVIDGIMLCYRGNSSHLFKYSI